MRNRSLILKAAFVLVFGLVFLLASGVQVASVAQKRCHACADECPVDRKAADKACRSDCGSQWRSWGGCADMPCETNEAHSWHCTRTPPPTGT